MLGFVYPEGGIVKIPPPPPVLGPRVVSVYFDYNFNLSFSTMPMVTKENVHRHSFPVGRIPPTITAF